MSSTRRGYAPLSNPTTDPDDDRELEAAFGGADSDGDDDDESTPLRPSISFPAPSVPMETRSTSAIPGAYDFERPDYDRPPPGSPPAPSTIALPNNYGNSNGVTGTAAAIPPAPRPNAFRRALGVLLPQHYAPLPTEAGPSTRVVGGGQANDGVFGNVVAKPGRSVTVTGEDGSVYMAPEESQREQPPSYQVAQLDSAPPYFDVSVHALDPAADMIIDDLPTGSLVLFAANTFISFFFQFVGFLMTYIMHTSHAAKYGSRAGLGLTLLQFGWYSKQNAQETINNYEAGIGFTGDGSDAARFANGTWGEGGMWMHGSSNGTLSWPQEEAPVVTPEMAASYAATRAWIAFLLMAMGWVILVSSIYGFWRVKRWERSVRASAMAASGASSASTSTTPFRERFRERVRRGLSNIRARRQRDQGRVEEATPMVEVAVDRNQSSQLPAATPAERMERLLREAHMVV